MMIKLLLERRSKEICVEPNDNMRQTAERSLSSYSKFFKDGFCDFRTFENNLTLDIESFVGRNLASSFAPKEGDSKYMQFVDALSRLFSKYSVNGKLVMHNITRSYVGKI